MMRNIIRNWTACIGMVVTLAACDDYLDITPKGKALLKSTEDYLGLIEDRSPEYDMMNSWILAGEARRVEKLYQSVELGSLFLGRVVRSCRRYDRECSLQCML